MKRILFLLTVLSVPILGMAQQQVSYKYDASGNQITRTVTKQSQNYVSKQPQKSSDASIISDIGSVEDIGTTVMVNVDTKSETLKILANWNLPQDSKFNLFQADGSLVRSSKLEAGCKK